LTISQFMGEKNPIFRSMVCVTGPREDEYAMAESHRIRYEYS
jgi:hypothetical protein